jgi:hypothetical protein
MRRGQVIARQAGAAPVPVLRKWVEHALSDTGLSGAAADRPA